MNKTKKTSKMLHIAVGILLLLFLIILCYSCGQELAVSEYEDKVNCIKEIDVSKRQAELNAIVEEGKMNVNYSPQATFQGTISKSFNIKNIKNNHHPIIFEIIDENGRCIYASKKIEPGYELSQIELDEELPKGIHNCKIIVGYAEEGNVSSAFPLTIEVK